MPMVYHRGRRKAIVYADGAYGLPEGKTAHDLVIFNGGLLWDIVAVVDRRNAGRDAGEVLGIEERGIPVVGSLGDALRYQPSALILGAAPVGGRLPEEWLDDIERALSLGIDVYSGLHTFLSDIPRLRRAAESSGARIVDVRKPDPSYLRIWDGSVLLTRVIRVLVAGTDCDAGKNIVTYTLYEELARRGIRACMVGTGQTMLLLGARGIVADAVPSDFVAGAVEKAVVDEAERGCEAIVVEGQAAISHEAYGHVSLGILRGAAPTHIVIAHVPGRTTRAGFEHAAKPLPVPEPREEILYLRSLNPYPDMVVAGIALNTSMLGEEDAKRLIEKYSREYLVPVTDPLRFGVSAVAERILETRVSGTP
ncbi:DUF1611 domain-containing protein [Pyrofollis japonicus]|nr:DUF1611 domain-containing protein [Pyrofollis japonicus]